MIWAANDVVGALVFLLPGPVASAVYFSLTSHPKPNEFGQVVQALMFTILSQTVAWAIGLAWPQMGSREDWQLFFPVPVAAVMALIAAFCSNHDIVHSILRRAKATRETSYPSEWYSAFAENDDFYVVRISTTGAGCMDGRRSGPALLKQGISLLPRVNGWRQSRMYGCQRVRFSWPGRETSPWWNLLEWTTYKKPKEGNNDKSC